MKILTLGRIVGIAAIGVAYVHGKRGGNFTLGSIADTLNHLWSSASERLGLAQRAQPPMSGRTVSPSNAAGTSAGNIGGSSAGSSAANGLTGDRTRRPYNG